MTASGAFESDRDVPNLAMGYTHWRLKENGEAVFEPGERRNTEFMSALRRNPSGGTYARLHHHRPLELRLHCAAGGGVGRGNAPPSSGLTSRVFLSGRLLLGDAMEGAEAPDQIAAVHRNDAARGKTSLHDCPCTLVIALAEDR